MALPKSLTQPLRQGQLNVGSGWRGYFAPFNQQLAVTQTSTSIGPTIYDLESLAKFIDPPTPSGWIDMGLIDKFKLTPGSKIGNVVTGYRGAVRAKYRAEVAEKCSFVFREMSNLAMKIATGSQVFNILYTTSAPSTVGPLSSTGTAAIAMASGGYQPTGQMTGPTTGQPTLYVPAGSGAAFPAGSFIVADQDYDGTSFGYVGDAGANVFQGAVSDVDFIRKTSDYVATVKQVVANALPGNDGLILTRPFIGGGNAIAGVTPNNAPSAGAKVQRIYGYASREGGTFIKEWSGIFIMDTLDRNQLLIYYPRLSPDTFAGWDEQNLQNTNIIHEAQMNSTYEAMAFDDPLDGETVVSYRAFFPAPGIDIQS